MLRAAIVGAGPSGFYATEQLLKAGFAVDLYDALPTPFGLVRAGVAPDHPKIKSVTRVYAKTAQHERLSLLRRCRARRRHLPRGSRWPATTPSSTRSGRRPTTASGSPARIVRARIRPPTFVAWYNGHPHFADQHVRPQRRPGGGDRQRQRRHRRGPHAGPRSRRAGAHRHGRPRA